MMFIAAATTGPEMYRPIYVKFGRVRKPETFMNATPGPKMLIYCTCIALGPEMFIIECKSVYLG